MSSKVGNRSLHILGFYYMLFSFLVYAEEFEKANPQDIIDLCYGFHRQYHPNIRFLIDGSNAGLTRQMKVVFCENPDYDPKDSSPQTQEIIPISLNSEHKQMLSHLYLMLNEGLSAMHEKYQKLTISLRKAQAKEYSIDRQETSYDDLLDALRFKFKRLQYQINL